MIPNDALTNALRSLKFEFKDQTQRVTIWKQKGTTKRVIVHKRDFHDEITARSVLTQAGMPLGAIQQFIETARRRRH